MDAAGEREVVVMSLERDDGDRGDEQRRERNGGRGGAVAVRVVVVVVVVVVAARRAAVFLAAGARLYDRELEAVGLGIRGDPNHDRVRGP